MKNLFKTWVLIGMLVLTVSAWAGMASTPVQVIKSPNDARNYEYLVLDNGLRVILVSDPEADKAAAALTVGVGSVSNPPDRPGLAHFLEHMLFLGTKKYPEVDEYSGFIKRHGGSQNAFTADNQTTYYFDIKADQLEPALDRFAQFFVAPLFDAEFVEREKHAVHSEYQLKLKEDSRRIDAAQKQSLNPDSPYARFAVGNLDSLADRPGRKVRDDLLAFYNKHYSSDIMGLAVVGKEPLSQLRQWVVDKFSAVPNRKASRYTPSESELLYRQGQLPLKVDVVPIKDLHKLSFSFPMPSAKKYYRERPYNYLAHFIGDEGRGSLYSLLRNRGWISALNAGGSSLDAVQGFFQVDIDLTPEGVKHVDEIAALLFQYVELLRSKGIEAWRFDELKRKSELDFRFKEKTSASHYVTALSGRLLDYPSQDLLRGGKVLQRFDADLIRHFLSYLRPDNVAVTLVDQNLKTDSLEPLYQVPYRISKIEPAQLTKTDNRATLALPKPNPFMPEKALLKTAEKTSAIPELIEKAPGFAVWYRHDTEFGVPRGVFSVDLELPQTMDSLQHAMELNLLLRLVEDELNEFSYPAQLAGLGYDLSRTREGLNLVVYGYDEKQALLLGKLLKVLKKPKLASDRFVVFKEQLLRELANKAMDRPYRQVYEERTRQLLEPAWSPVEKMTAVQTISRDDVLRLSQQAFNEAEVRVLVHGNFSRSDATELVKLLRTELLADTRMRQVAEPRYRIIDKGQTLRVEYPVDHPDAVVLMNFPGVKKDVVHQARWRMLGQLLSNPFYAELRTRQQLGYAVFAMFSEVENHPGLVTLVQTSSVSAPELEKRMAAFLQDYVSRLEKMGDEEFASHKAGLISKLTKKDESLLARTQRYLDDLEREWYSFDFRQQLADAVASVSRQQLIDFYRSHLLQQPRRLLIYSPGKRFGESIGKTPILSEGKKS